MMVRATHQARNPHTDDMARYDSDRWRGYGLVDSDKGFLLADGQGGRTREDRDTFGEWVKGFERLWPKKTLYAFDANIDMTGTTDEPWRNRIRAANAAYRQSAIREIANVRRTCRKTMACMLRKLPEELVIVVMDQSVQTFCPRIESSVPDSRPLRVTLREISSCLFAITQDPPENLTKHAVDSIIRSSTFCLRAFEMKEPSPRFPVLLDSAYKNVRYLELSVHMPDEAEMEGREYYPTELYRSARMMASFATCTPRVQSCVLEMRFPAPYPKDLLWEQILDTSCRKGFGSRSTYGAEIGTLIETFVKEGPGTGKVVKLILVKSGKEATVDLKALDYDNDADGVEGLGQKVLRIVPKLIEA
nr:hypothetical protein B0A51_03603 [Rachicladosporium sp. CCFEE 5018]